jgi:hypothetical protein
MTMKKSNKILLGGLLTIIFLLVAIHVGLFAKYKSGDFVVYDETTMNRDLIVNNYNNVNKVVVSNRANTIIKFGENTRIEQYRRSDAVRINQSGNVLMISGKDTSDQAKNSGFSVVVYVKEGTQIEFINARATIKENKAKNFTALQVVSKDSYVEILGTGKGLHIDSLQLNASERSHIYLGNLQLQTLNIQLNESILMEEESTMNQIFLNTDDKSTIQFQSKNFLKIKTNTTATNE